MEIGVRILEPGGGAEIIEWWTLLGAREEMTLGELRKMNCVGDDNVHLREIVNRKAAEILCHRLLEIGRLEAGASARLETSRKRLRLE